MRQDNQLNWLIVTIRDQILYLVGGNNPAAIKMRMHSHSRYQTDPKPLHSVYSTHSNSNFW